MAIQGIGGLRNKMAALPALIEKRGAEALEKSADEIVAMMKRLVPVDRGDLRDSVGWTWGDAPKGSFTLLKSRRGDFAYKGMRITIYAGDEVAFYAHMIEFGTVKMAAHPFFYVSYRSLKKRTRNRIARATRKALKEVAAMPNGN